MSALPTPDDAHRRALLSLITLQGMGPKRLRCLLDAFGAPLTALNASTEDWLRAGIPRALAAARPRGDEARVGAMLDWLSAHPSHHLLLPGDLGYPAAFNNLPDAPAALFARGDIRLLDEPQLAIVGARSATTGGLQNARAFARHLAGAGLVITSGLALGIDAAAHEGALAAGGATIAVMGTGPDVIYPSQHRMLAERMLSSGGLLISEWPPGTPARKEHFPRRNRLISGLADGVLVVEAGMQSGSLITARLATEQGREVFAIPGSIHNPMARGCHRLIRDGAKLVETAQDIFEELAPRLGARLHADGLTSPTAKEEATMVPREESHARLLDLLGFDPQTADTLIHASGLTPAEVSSILLMLELDGLISTLPGGLYCRTA